MFDIMHDQAAGLRAVAPPAGIRLVPVVLSRDADAAFDVVWILGAGLSAMGRNVVALDATSREQPNRPGLAQMLQSTAQPGGGADAPAWQILPSQSGLSSLMHTAQTEGATASLNRLAAAFTVDTIVLVLAPKEWLSVLFEESQARPLVPFSLEASGVVDAYSAVKVLFQAGGLQPVLMPVPSAVPDALVAQGVGVLSDTALRHLGWVPDSWPVPAFQPGESGETASQWMLRIEGSALALEGGCVMPPSWLTPHLPEALIPKLWSC